MKKLTHRNRSPFAPYFFLIHNCRQGVSLKIHSPRQLRPSPEYPGLHDQLYDPLVLIHSASALQSWVALVHSSISSKS